MAGVLLEGFYILEGSHVDPVRRAVLEQRFNLAVALGRNGTVRGDRLDEKEPVPLGPVEDDVRQSVVRGDRDLELGKLVRVENEVLYCGVPDVQKIRAWCETWVEFLDDGDL